MKRRRVPIQRHRAPANSIRLGSIGESPITVKQDVSGRCGKGAFVKPDLSKVGWQSSSKRQLAPIVAPLGVRGVQARRRRHREGLKPWRARRHAGSRGAAWNAGREGDE